MWSFVFVMMMMMMIAGHSHRMFLGLFIKYIYEMNLQVTVIFVCIHTTFSNINFFFHLHHQFIHKSMIMMIMMMVIKDLNRSTTDKTNIQMNE